MQHFSTKKWFKSVDNNYSVVIQLKKLIIDYSLLEENVVSKWAKISY